MRNKKQSKHAYSDTRSKTLGARTVRTKGATLRRVNDTLPGVQRRGSPLAGLWGLCRQSCLVQIAVIPLQFMGFWQLPPALGCSSCAAQPHSAARAAGTLQCLELQFPPHQQRHPAAPTSRAGG